ncbi:invasion associated locus B family protein [Hoeflea sp. AS60]|uniref:invasion associated locus B family protein n=1 Tax=Hoeflea sp. AS60 TaxID=3135780 RepID=UPI00317C9BDD
MAFAQEVSLPGNASSLTEAHGDWTVKCAVVSSSDGAKTKRCSLSQQQVAQQTGQRALAIELTTASEGASGSLVLPFGLALERGVTYQLDDGPIGATQTFRTCLPVGCVVDVTFDAGTLASFRSGKQLQVTATADGGQEMIFSISLSGFSSALDRVVALLES